MNLKSKSDPELLSTLKLLVGNERKLLMEILYSLQEVETRSLHLEMGYPNLYTFAIKELGYSSGSAYRRISAMRLLKSVPEVASKLASGELGLENASQAQSFFRKEDQNRKDQGQEKLSLDEKRETVSQLLGKSTREGQRILMERAPDIMTPTEKLRSLPEQKTMVQFVASAELMGKLEELKNLLAHQNYDGRMDVLIEKLADVALKKLKPTHLSPAPGMIESSRGERTHSQTPISRTQSMSSQINRLNKPMRSRYIPTQIRRQVLLRDKNGCTYKDPKTGRACGSRHGLQFDHLVPFSWGGKHLVDNLALRCGAHNRLRAEQMRLI